jgi:hypothetical protein
MSTRTEAAMREVKLSELSSGNVIADDDGLTIPFHNGDPRVTRVEAVGDHRTAVWFADGSATEALSDRRVLIVA